MSSERTEKALELLRDLPTEVSLDTVGQMVVAFPLLPAAASWTNYINFNTIAMTSAGTLLIAGAAYFLSPVASEPLAELPEPVVEAVVEAPVELDAVVWPGPVKKDPQKPEPATKAIVAVTVEPEPTPEPEPTLEPEQVQPVARTTPPAAPAPIAFIVTAERKDPETSTYDLQGFTSVSVRGSLEVVIEQGPFNVTVEERDGDGLVAVTMEGKTLVIAPNSRNEASKRGCGEGPHVAVGMPGLERVELNGSGGVHVGDFTDMAAMEVVLNGSGDVHFARFTGLRKLSAYLAGSGDIHGESVDVSGTTKLNLAGSGDISIHGSTEELDVDLVGSGDVDASALRSGSCKIKVIGSGDVVTSCRDRLDRTVTGSGEVHNSGSARGREADEAPETY